MKCQHNLVGWFVMRPSFLSQRCVHQGYVSRPRVVVTKRYVYPCMLLELKDLGMPVFIVYNTTD